MKKLLLTLVMALSMLALPAFASDSLFNGREFSLTLGSGYVVNTHATSVRGAFNSPYTFNLDAGASYFVNKYVGVEASVPFYQTKGVSVDEVRAGLVARLPIGHVAPYIGLGGVYNWQASSDTRWAYEAKAGAELRFNAKWGTFVEGNYRNANFDWNRGDVSVRGGLRVVF